MKPTRRELIATLSLAGAAALVTGCHQQAVTPVPAKNTVEKTEEAPTEEEGSEPDVTAVEDLMREHGILRRALLVYQESTIRLRDSPASVSPAALEKTAQLFRAFGEDYHEKKLEEAYIFPAIRKSQATVVDVLLAQHARGREITDYILATTKADKIPSGTLTRFIGALESFVRMYEHHAAIEDTLIFPAWKTSLKEGELDEIGAKFEEIEQQQFGEDGFDLAVKRVSEIEESLGLSNLGIFTAPAPPTVKTD